MRDAIFVFFFVVGVTMALSSGFLIVVGESGSSNDVPAEWDHLPRDDCERHHTAVSDSANATVRVCGPSGIEAQLNRSNGTVGHWFGIRTTDGAHGGVWIEPHHDRAAVAYLHELGHAQYGPNHTDSGIMQPTTDATISCDLRPRTRDIAETFNTTSIEERNGCDVVVTPFGTVGA